MVEYNMQEVIVFVTTNKKKIQYWLEKTIATHQICKQFKHRPAMQVLYLSTENLNSWGNQRTLIEMYRNIPFWIKSFNIVNMLNIFKLINIMNISADTHRLVLQLCMKSQRK